MAGTFSLPLPSEQVFTEHLRPVAEVLTLPSCVQTAAQHGGPSSRGTGSFSPDLVPVVSRVILFFLCFALGPQQVGTKRRTIYTASVLCPAAL